MTAWQDYSSIHLHFINLYLSEINQLEDPRQQWRKEQEHMLEDYLVTAQIDLEVDVILLQQAAALSLTIFLVLFGSMATP